MNRHLQGVTLAIAVGLGLASLRAAETPPIAERAARAVLEYAGRIETANAELAAVRRTVSAERAPLMDTIRAVEEELAALDADIARLEVERARVGQKAQELRTEEAALDRNFSYITHVALDGIKAMEAGLRAGERALWDERVTELRESIEHAGRPVDVDAALQTTAMLVTRLREQLGGHRVEGTAIAPDDNLIQRGTFVFAGPEVYFVSHDNSLFGTVRERRGSSYAVAHPIPRWERSQADALTRGELTKVPIDGSGGRALRLLETRGGVWSELRKGGLVGYVIMGLGVLAAALVVMKLKDLQQLEVDAPTRFQPAVQAIARSDRTGAQAMLGRLRPTTRDLLALALRHIDAPSSLLEEHLEALVLRHRLNQERRLPLLAVIATAGPLLGLLGTVTGMIKTFTLITVFGTGSAGRLSGGISEALVATALGLAVAIPTLVVHGFLSHRIHKSLALLERHALEVVTAVKEARSARVMADS